MTIRTNMLLALAALTTSGSVLATPVTYSYSGSLDQFVVQEDGFYSFVAIGAGGGSSEGNPNGPYFGGAGERITGNLFLTAQTMLSIIVGGAGESDITGGGGGGTFVYIGSTPYLIAGGGGGAGFNGAGSSATGSTAGGAGMGAGGAAGGTNGSGGAMIGNTRSRDGYGGGGAGFTGRGGNAMGPTDGRGGDTAPSFAGGASSAVGNSGGFGGGGGGGDAGGGGGGGYSGGGGGGTSAAGPSGGGYGGSFATAGFTDLTFTSANNAGGNGLFSIELLPAVPPVAGVPEPGSLALLVAGALGAAHTRRRRRSRTS